MENMNNQTNTQDTQNTQPSQGAGERTFTQEDVNRIVSDRLARDRDKRSAELDEREKAVKARELAVMAAEKLAEAGLPKALSAVLRYDDETSLDSAIQTLSHLRGFGSGKDEPDKGKQKEKLRVIEVNHLKHGEPYAQQDLESQLQQAFRAKKLNE